MSDLRLQIFDGTRQLFSVPARFLVTITDGRGQQRLSEEFTDPVIVVTDLPFFDNENDNYSVVVSADGYQQAGFQPAHLHGDVLNTLDIMLVGKDPGFSFVNARWPAAKQAYPFLSGADEDPAAAEARYENLMDQSEESLACLLNLNEAMSLINLPQYTPLAYLKLLYWEGNYPYAKPPAQDRYYAWCDRGLVDQVKQAEKAGTFVPAPYVLHPGATNSWKQVQFGEANVQLTFHENAVHPENPDWIIVEPDIDYYKNTINHLTLEVLPNEFPGNLTNPISVYVLRWIAGQTMQTPEFAPLYTLD